MTYVLAMMIFVTPIASAAGLADASRGARILADRQCFECHDFARNAGRASTGPLAKLRRTHLKPAQLVGAIWSHLPAMWGGAGGKAPSTVVWSERDASDVLAWFAAAGYFEPAGDSRKGALLFASQGCDKCHAPTAEAGPVPPGNGDALPVDRWTSLHDPIGLLHAAWRHAPSMKASLDRKTMNWPSLTVSELADILAYVYSLNPPKGPGLTLALGDTEKGKAVYSMKGCASCHSRIPAEREAGLLHSFTELSAVFWNHAPMMTSLPASLTREEIADVVAYLWASRYFEDSGNVVRGKAVFERKRCITCHAEPRPVAKKSAIAMLAAVWKHSPAVVQQAKEKGAAWAKFEGGEMADLLAYLSMLRK